MPDCLFCKIRDGEIPAKIVFRDEECLAFEDLRPQAPTHLLFIPLEHISTLNEVDLQNEALVGHLVVTAAKHAKELGFSEAGYRLVMNCNRDAGQTVFHLHLHLLGGRPFEWPPG